MKYCYILFFTLLLAACSQKTFVASNKGISYKVDSTATANLAIATLIDPYTKQLTSKISEVVGYTPAELQLGKPESALGNAVADAIQTMAQERFPKPLDATLLNWGGLRVPYLPKGNITIGKIYELLPFDNRVIVMELEGATLQQLLDATIAGGGWPMSKSLRVAIKDGKCVNIFIHNQPLDLQKKYTVVLPDYVANGGDKCSFLIPLNRTDLGILLRNMLIQYFRTHKQLIGNIEGRITMLTQ
ncbi:MAG: 5'-nucleotidase C-terminal domain-containing protein [Saprospiraceae bacterium]|nr:5'-nucleotidase C-terminal domain-containing protein [Saprospiraceae bacterium]MBP7679656.1 5'-nucleotidase C-terminal domain-containing protein [Saprospiraceae bacterium]